MTLIYWEDTVQDSEYKNLLSKKIIRLFIPLKNKVEGHNNTGFNIKRGDG